MDLLKNCNLQLFRKLIEVTHYDYKSQDNLGRTIIHACVWSNNIDLLNLIYGVERNIQNIPDQFGLLPITYAALLGNKTMVKEFLRRDALIKSSKKLHSAVISKFQPMLKNLNKLVEEESNKECLRKLVILTEQTKKDFNYNQKNNI